MSETLRQILALVQAGEIRISEHGYDELAEDGISVREIIGSLANAEVVEDYPGFLKGPCVLVLQKDAGSNPIHAVWGIPKGLSEPAVLVTAYRPDPAHWVDEFRSRRK